MHLTQKERSLLKDMQSHESVCIAKYENYAQQAQDPQLQQLFSNYAQTEQQHYDTLAQVLQGQAPNMTQSQGQSAQQSPGQWSTQMNEPAAKTGFMNEADALLCSDALMTEKYVSGAYDTVVFEAANPTVRQVVQHIQDEEQQHGEGIFNYMNSHGMYQLQ
jgi:spore coat protein CotF